MSFKIVRDWLTYFRVHTANLTMAMVAIGLLLAGRSLFTIDSALFILWGLIYHAQGFMENCLLDLPQDRRDPSKQHFALVNGRLPVWRARAVQRVLELLTILGGLALCWRHDSWLGVLVLVLAWAAGSGYNYLSKRTLIAPLWITVAFVSVLLFPYMTVQAPHFDTTIMLVLAYLALQMIYQITVEGYLKDLLVDPVNLMRTLGCKARDTGLIHPDRSDLDVPDRAICIRMGTLKFIMIGRAAYLYATLLISVKVIVGCLVYESLSDSYFGLPGVLLLGSGILQLLGHLNLVAPDHVKPCTEVQYDNAKVVRWCSVIEVCTYFSLVFALWPLLGGQLVALLVLAPILWFLVMNQLTWGAWRPRV